MVTVLVCPVVCPVIVTVYGELGAEKSSSTCAWSTAHKFAESVGLKTCITTVAKPVPVTLKDGFADHVPLNRHQWIRADVFVVFTLLNDDHVCPPDSDTVLDIDEFLVMVAT
jgi:hypothetical protein